MSTRMRVLVACEFSGVVRDAFLALGHDAWSCDLLPTESPGPHYGADVREVLESTTWDLMIAHPPCTHLATSGARWFKDKADVQEEALDFIRFLLNAPVPRIALENPVGIISTRIKRPTQVVDPWEFGDGVSKATCWWLKNLPKLRRTDVVQGRSPRIASAPDIKDRWKFRSRFFPGMAKAMADQWGKLGPFDFIQTCIVCRNTFKTTDDVRYSNTCDECSEELRRELGI